LILLVAGGFFVWRGMNKTVAGELDDPTHGGAGVNVPAPMANPMPLPAGTPKPPEKTPEPPPDPNRLVELRSDPAGASVYTKTAWLGVTPLRVSLKLGEAENYKFTHQGYKVQWRKVAA